ncbi:MAG: anthranilate synthase component I family protein, partial [Armatimonadota bacterium]
MPSNSGAIVRPIPAPASTLAAFNAIRDAAPAFLLDSVVNVGGFGRHSFLGADPFLVFAAKGRRIRIHRPAGRDEELEGDPFEVLRRLLAEHQMPRPDEAAPFFGGAVGYFGYELRHHVERCTRIAADDFPVPDCYLGFYDRVIAVDHHRHEAFSCAVGDAAAQKAESLERVIRGARREPRPSDRPAIRGRLRSNFTKHEYLTAVRCAKDYIAAGDIYQANLSQRFSAALAADPFDVYLRLRRANPAPFAAYLDCGDLFVACSSPELFLRLDGQRVMTRPIKGTRPRAPTPARDAAMRRELLNSEKDRAELLMITDLERNDLGRVCEYGSVRVPQLLTVETYAAVHHLVATVVGVLRPDADPVDLLRA